MPRMLFTKEEPAIWISHLDLMRLLQRGFRRAGIQLKHSQGYSPHPSLSIALPLSVGVASEYELADFELEEQLPLEALPQRLSDALPQGVRVLRCWDDGQKLGKLKWLKARLELLYDQGVPDGAAAAIRALFSREALPVEKQGKNGSTIVDVIPMLHGISVEQAGPTALHLTATVSAQNPTLNPLLLGAAITAELPTFRPDFVRCRRLSLYDESMNLFE